MTKREFYERMRSSRVTIRDIDLFIDEEDLWEIVEIVDYDSYCDRLWDEINNWYGSLQELGEYLSSIDFNYSYYYMEHGGCVGGIDESDVSDILDTIEQYYENHEATEWYSELPEAELKNEEKERDILRSGMDELLNSITII